MVAIHAATVSTLPRLDAFLRRAVGPELDAHRVWAAAAIPIGGTDRGAAAGGKVLPERSATIGLRLVEPYLAECKSLRTRIQQADERALACNA